MSTLDPLTTVLLGLVPVLVLLLAGAGWLIRHEQERREEIENQLSEKKYTAYIRLIDIFFDVLKASRTHKQPPVDLIDQMIDANKGLLIFGTDEVFLEYQAWTRSSSQGEKVLLHGFAKMILAIRRDMGHPNTKLTTDDILRSFIIDFDQMRQEGRI